MRCPEKPGMTGMTGMTGMARDDRDGRDGWGVAVMHMGVLAMMLKMTTTLYAWDLNPSHPHHEC